MSALAISPHTSVRWSGGKIRISSANSKKFIHTRSHEILAVLSKFSSPKTPRQVAHELPGIKERETLQSINVLRQIDVLVSAPKNRKTKKTAEREKAAQLETTLLLSQDIMTLMNEIGVDLTFFGTHKELPTDSLQSVHAILSEVATELRHRRPLYIKEQLDRLHVTTASRGLKVNVGAGGKKIKSWINIDSPPGDLALNLLWGLPLPNASVDFIYFSHVLEHFYYKDQALFVLKEFRRTLSSKGVVRIVVPDIEKCIEAYVSRNHAFFENRKKLFDWAAQCNTRLEHFLGYAGANVKPGNFLEHKYGYDYETLEQLLREAGFKNITRSDYMASKYKILRIDDTASHVANFKIHEAHYSLFVEAQR